MLGIIPQPSSTIQGSKHGVRLVYFVVRVKQPSVFPHWRCFLSKSIAIAAVNSTAPIAPSTHKIHILTGKGVFVRHSRIRKDHPALARSHPPIHTHTHTAYVVPSTGYSTATAGIVAPWACLIVPSAFAAARETAATHPATTERKQRLDWREYFHQVEDRRCVGRRARPTRGKPHQIPVAVAPAPVRLPPVGSGRVVLRSVH